MLELSGVLVMGIFAQWLAWKIKLPAILPLILIGLAIGPFSTLITPDGSKILDGDEIFNGELLFAFVSISVAVILFEGGLTLKFKEIRTLATAVRNLLTIGVLVTLIGGTLAAHFILGLNFNISLLFGALVIVSGPTVVTPILKNVKPNPKINTILKWEGILIDPLGALIAVLAYEFVRSSGGGNLSLHALKDFILSIATGFFIGVISAFLLSYLLRKNRIPAFLRNVISLAVVILSFGFSELVIRESGLLTVTIMGVLLANLRLPELKYILTFKEDISRIDIDQINKLGWESLLVFLFMILIVRPLAVYLSTTNSNLDFREKVFISWIGPKGIVAAAVASLFSLELASAENGVSNAESLDASMLLPLVFMMIVGTVIIQGSSAKLVANWLGVGRVDPQGVLFIGANQVARKLAAFLKQHGVPVYLTDTNHANIVQARMENLPAYEGNVLKDDILEELDLSHMGRVIALTSNNEINMLACKRFMPEFGEDNTHRPVSEKELELRDLERPRNLLFDSKADLRSLESAFEKDQVFHELNFSNQGEFDEFMLKNKRKIIPLFIRHNNKKIRIFSGLSDEISKGDVLVFLKTRESDPEEEISISNKEKQ